MFKYKLFLMTTVIGLITYQIVNASKYDQYLNNNPLLLTSQLTLKCTIDVDGKADCLLSDGKTLNPTTAGGFDNNVSGGFISTISNQYFTYKLYANTSDDSLPSRGGATGGYYTGTRNKGAYSYVANYSPINQPKPVALSNNSSTIRLNINLAGIQQGFEAYSGSGFCPYKDSTSPDQSYVTNSVEPSAMSETGDVHMDGDRKVDITILKEAASLSNLKGYSYYSWVPAVYYSSPITWITGAYFQIQLNETQDQLRATPSGSYTASVTLNYPPSGPFGLQSFSWQGKANTLKANTDRFTTTYTAQVTFTLTNKYLNAAKIKLAPNEQGSLSFKYDYDKKSFLSKSQNKTTSTPQIQVNIKGNQNQQVEMEFSQPTFQDSKGNNFTVHAKFQGQSTELPIQATIKDVITLADCAQ
ncbi:MAG: hypothetical protein O2809_01340, partial [Proteobacteria bacterium]|nr:hypothetical protein [Pseudomonadota bacterium]